MIPMLSLLLLASASQVLVRANRLIPNAIYLDVAGEVARITTLPLNLNYSGQSVIFDYGHEAGGTPYFVVSQVDQPVQIESKYSEERNGLFQPNADGPFPFAIGLSGTFRVESFNVTSPGLKQSYFIQGGQRWQSITQLTEGALTISEVGLILSADYPESNELPGHFNSSNEAYNEIWKLGALASSAACLNAGTQNATWDVTPEGALIRGQKPAVSAIGTGFLDYTLTFSTKIIKGGTGWSIAQTPSSSGIQILLVSELAPDTTFVNTNTSITPPNSIVLANGYSFVNQTTLPTQYIGSFKIDQLIKEDQWYRIDTSLSGGNKLTVALNRSEILNITLSDYGVELSNLFNPSASPGQGSWGFGPWQDQIALIQGVVVTADNGTVLYENEMTSQNILSEYGVAQNNATICLDGPKRDRLVWLGDFFHTSQIIASSNGRQDHVLGTLQYFLDWQNDEGLFPIAPPMGYDPIYAEQLGGYLALFDYQTLGLLAFTEYYELTGDEAFAQELWPGFKKQISWLLSQVNASTSLADIGGFTGPASGTAVSAQLVQALNGAAKIATNIGDTASALNYTEYATKIADAVDSLLWNEKLGSYITSLSAPNNFSVADISFAITSGIAFRNQTRLYSLIAALDQLKLGPGYKDSTAASSDDLATNISPNTNGFLIRALMLANATSEGKFLLDNLWTAMIANDSTKTGASWEYVNAHDRSPGLGLFTSLSHPWGGAPTYVLPQWIAGLRPITPGYEEWAVMPAVRGFDVDWAECRIPTQFGELTVKWELERKSLRVEISAPEGTKGSFALPDFERLGNWTLNGKEGNGGTAVPLGAGSSVLTLTVEN